MGGTNAELGSVRVNNKSNSSSFGSSAFLLLVLTEEVCYFGIVNKLAV